MKLSTLDATQDITDRKIKEKLTNDQYDAR